MKSLVFDIETDGLDAKKIWCISALDVDTEQQYSYGPSELSEGFDMLLKADKLIGHNIIGFDIPVINKLTGLNLMDKELVDTLVLSRLFNPVREGNHGLERWGYALGSPKIEFDQYDSYSVEMLKYCEQDVYLNYQVYKALKKESKGFSRQSVVLEHETNKILSQQRDHGFLFDVEEATKLLGVLNSRLAEIVNKINECFKPKQEVRKIFRRYSPQKKLLKTGVDNFGKNTRITDEEYATLKTEAFVERVYIKDFNPASRQQIGEYLQDFGWEPLEHTPTGQPKIDEKILSQIKGIPEAEVISEFLMIQKRISQISSWFKELDEDTFRVHGFVNHNGTITGRMTHRNPNMAQIPSSSSSYGKECRACWTIPKGYKLVGIDASGLELRMLAHYMNDEEYTNEILNGDIHTTNQKLAGLESRNQAKTFIYALLYGAGDAKLGTVAGGGKSVGRNLRKSFISNLPSFKALKDRVAGASAKGYLKALDGRKLYIRSEHSALNTLLQGAGAIVMKQALIILNDKIKDLDAHFVANVHDEWQIEVREDLADTVGKLGVEAIIEAGKVLKLKCPLDGEYKTGDNWSETH
jgi:DNA polymerase I-like protein with 3'-5' exonuclease and polymerase domains